MSAPFVLIAERYERKSIAVTANSSIYQQENSVGVATLASLRRPNNGSRFDAFGLISN